MIVKNSGKVGIGITSPTEKLEVNGNIKQSAGSRTLTQEIRALDANGLKLCNYEGKGIMVANSGSEIWALDANGLKLNNSAGNGIVINNSGNVGIGMNPTNKLDVAGTVNATAFIGNGSGLTNATDYRLNASYSGSISTNGSMILGINNYTGTDQDEIIITDPQFEVRPSSEVNRKSANFVDGDGRRIFFVPKLSNFGYNPIATENDAGIFWSDGEAQGNNQNEFSGLVIGPHKSDSVGASRGIKIDKDGNVGIGKAIPTAMLDVNGDAMIDGLLHVDNIDVANTLHTNILEADNFNVTQLNTTTFSVTDILYAGEIHVQNVSKWKDCVFEESYKLISLKETEAFIKQNRHLPGIPSEKEVLDNGINVSEMNALLLQKIEELTLYIIEQQKRIELLENKK